LLLTLAQQVKGDNPVPTVDDDFGLGTVGLNHWRN
jgi:hypothetical protein